MKGVVGNNEEKDKCDMSTAWSESIQYKTMKLPKLVKYINFYLKSWRIGNE